MTIGISMIVRDAEHTIERALQSCTFASQIVVVDTGSKDATPHKVLRYGAELHFLTWRDDFSFARNYALGFMRTNWIVQLDADEYIENPEQWTKSIASIHDTHTIAGGRIQLGNVLESGESRHHHSYTRLFRNNRDFYYEGSIHEQIAPSIEKAGFVIETLPLSIIHIGYQENNQQKYERNARIIDAELVGNPNDPFLLYHAGNTAFALHNYTKAHEHYVKVHQSTQLSEEQQDIIRMRLAQIAIAQSDYAAAKQYMQNPSAYSEIEGLRQYLLGSVFAIEGHYADAIASLHNSRISSMVNRKNVAEFIQQLRTLI